MPMELLRQLAQRDQFPAPVVGEAEVDKLRVLRAAGMVQDELPGEGESVRSARVITITGLGRATLRAQAAREFIARRDRLPGTPLPTAKA